MGLYSGSVASSTELDPMVEASSVLQNPEELFEAYLALELSDMTDDEVKAFTESEECQAMLEAKKFSRKTIVRLTKENDMEKRTTMAAYQLAKEAKDPLWDKLVKYQLLKRSIKKQIIKKYGNKATKAARMGQREYMQKKVPSTFLKPVRDFGDGLKKEAVKKKK